MKAGVNKLDINKLFNVPTSFKVLTIKVDDLDAVILKTVLTIKVDDLDAVMLKTVSIDLTNLSDVMKNKVVKNKKFITLKTKLN